MSSERFTIALRKTKTPAHIQQALDMILYELEHFGRAITTNGSASRYLAHRLRQPKNNEYIYFGWNKQNQKSMIVLAHNVKLERIGDNKIKVIYIPNIEKS